MLQTVTRSHSLLQSFQRHGEQGVSSAFIRAREDAEMINVKPADISSAEVIRFPVCLGAALPAVFSRHTQSGACRKVESHHSLWSEGDERSHIILVRTGSVCFSRILPDGRRVVVGFAYPGDIIGLGSEHHPFDAETLQPSRLEAMPIAVFQRAVAEDQDFARLMRDEVSRCLMDAYAHIATISKLSASERLAHFLMDLSDRNQRRGSSAASVVLPMRRIDIADYLGLTIETVSRTFTQFRTDGLIAMDQPVVVFLRNIHRLAILARGDRDAAGDTDRLSRTV
jgi:CRP/FNR family transcriptional regulator, anaerobic regulatory protein